jgi:hypothetical protein
MPFKRNFLAIDYEKTLAKGSGAKSRSDLHLWKGGLQGSLDQEYTRDKAHRGKGGGGSDHTAVQ